jgi:hypothetical protein
MKPIREAFPDCGKDPDWFTRPAYEDLIASFCDALIVNVRENDYQGSSWLLLKRGEEFGVCEFGWGSCSGCDALEAVDSYEDLDELRDSLAAGTRWGTREETLRYVGEHDWGGSWGGDKEETRQFVAEATKALCEAAEAAVKRGGA